MNWIYKTDASNSARFILGIEGENPLICVGVNPSTAVPNHLDRTLKAVEEFSKMNGYDSWIMLNLYPQRATNPENLHLSSNDKIIKENIETIGDIFSKYKYADIWAAWGNLIESRSFLKECLKAIIDISDSKEHHWIYFGNLTKRNHPRHPLYLSRQSCRHRIDIDSYYSNLQI